MKKGTYARTIEIRDKNRQASKCNKNNLGKHWKLSEQSKINISNGHIGKKFTEEHKRKIGAKHKGKNHWNWKGGITRENQKTKNSIEYGLWREAVFARDNWICQKTKIKGGKLCVHHIQNFAQYPELRFTIDNGITLSKKAHKEFHKLYSRKNNTKKQIYEFLQKRQ